MSFTQKQQIKPKVNTLQTGPTYQVKTETNS